MTLYLRSGVLPFLICAVLSGCIGGNGAATAVTVVEVAENWAGSAVRSNGTPILQAERFTGTALRSNGQITVTTANGTFTSVGGPDVNGRYVAANGDSAQRIDTNLIGGTYENLVPLTVTINVAGTNNVSRGVFGLETPAAVLATAAAAPAAVYQGEAAIISQNTITGAVRHRAADTTITADFGAGTVNVVMQNVSVPAGVAATVDRMTVTGATITGSQFNGGVVTATLGGADARPAITGGGETTDVLGNFFGTDAGGGRPDEVGGIALIEGNNGSFTAIMVAD